MRPRSAWLRGLGGALITADPSPGTAGPGGSPGYDDLLVFAGPPWSRRYISTAMAGPGAWSGGGVAGQLEGGYPASDAVDGNLSTRWSSAFSDPQWLEVDLGATHTISKIVLNWENAYATAFQIQTSTDGTNWTTSYSTTTGTGGTQTLSVTGSGRYVRIYGMKRATGYGYSLWEFQVYGS